MGGCWVCTCFYIHTQFKLMNDAASITKGMQNEAEGGEVDDKFPKGFSKNGDRVRNLFIIVYLCACSIVCCIQMASSAMFLVN